jgi:peptide/nickel transport system substrate-binding protein
MKLSELLGISFIALMLGSLLLSGFPTMVVAQGTQPSCPTSDTLRWTLNGGVPNSISYLTASTYGAYETGFMNWLGSYPELSPTGAELWNYSMVDSLTPNSNFTQWSYHVRPGLKWSNGQPVTAQDVLATYGPNYAFNASYDFTGIHSEVAKEYAANSSTAVFVLSHSDAWFPLEVSPEVFVRVIPATEVSQYGSSYTGFGTPVVDGPFQLAGYTAGQSQAVMQRNPYWNSTGLPNPKICQIDVNYVESDASADTLLQEGATDLAPVDPSAAASTISNPNVHILQLLDSELMTLTYNMTTYPTNMTAFRQALVYAVDQNAIVQQAVDGYAGTAYSAEGIVPSTVTSYYNPNQMKYSFNASQALTLLSTIGITKGADGYLHYSNGTIVTLSVFADTEETKDTIAAGLLASNLQAIGMKVTTNIVARTVISSATTEAPATLYLTTGEAPVFPSPYIDALPGWDVYSHPAIPSTYWEYPAQANNEYNSNFTALDNTNNLTLVSKYLNNIEAINAQYLPVIVLCYPSFLWGYSTQRFTGWGTYPQSWVAIGGDIDYGQFNNLTPVSSTNSTSTSGSSTTTSISPLVYYAIGAVVVIIIVAVAVMYALRRRT